LLPFGYEFLRIPIPRTLVNRASEEGRSRVG
jgi:hypothetical protein